MVLKEINKISWNQWVTVAYYRYFHIYFGDTFKNLWRNHFTGLTGFWFGCANKFKKKTLLFFSPRWEKNRSQSLVWKCFFFSSNVAVSRLPQILQYASVIKDLWIRLFDLFNAIYIHYQNQTDWRATTTAIFPRYFGNKTEVFV